MTRNNHENGYTELDIMLLRAGAPTRFDSPYWTKQDVDWSAVATVFVKPVLSVIRTALRNMPRSIGRSALTA